MFGWQILSSGTNKAIILPTIIILSSVSQICPFGCTPPQTHQLYLSKIMISINSHKFKTVRLHKQSANNGDTGIMLEVKYKNFNYNHELKLCFSRESFLLKKIKITVKTKLPL